MVGQGGVTIGVPVAQHVAGARRNHQHRGAVVGPLLPRPVAGGIGHRQVPDDLGLAQAQRFAEAADGVEHVDAGPVGDAFVDEQSVQVPGAGAVVADPAPGRDEGRQQVGARGDLHLQQGVVAGGGQGLAQGPAQRTHPGQPAALVIGMEGHPVQAVEQAQADRIDHPVQWRTIGPGALQGPHQGHHMGHVAQGGQAQQAQGRSHRVQPGQDRMGRVAGRCC